MPLIPAKSQFACAASTLATCPRTCKMNEMKCWTYHLQDRRVVTYFSPSQVRGWEFGSLSQDGGVSTFINKIKNKCWTFLVMKILGKKKDIYLTSWAMMNAETRSRPGLSMKEKPLDRVTNIKAWLIVLTWRYTADANISAVAKTFSISDSSILFLLKFLTPKAFWKCQLKRKNWLYTKVWKHPKLRVRCQIYHKEVCLMSCPEEDNSGYSQICTNHYSSGKNFWEFPTIRKWRWLDPVLGYSHDSTWAWTCMNKKTQLCTPSLNLWVDSYHH